MLVAYHFAPQNRIGAVRLTKLAKYLTDYGYEVTVITINSESVDEKLNEDIKFFSNFIKVNHQRYINIIQHFTKK